ncbi:MAG TPA: response regulator [Gemmatimonadaceae bacterium]|nr:response regulator [Gemmatimonadaceae bacterium]
MSPAAPPHVLLVDDDLAVLRALDRALTRMGVRVSVAADAPTARSIVATCAVDAVVLDYRLPGTRGHLLLGELVALSPRLQRHAAFITGDISDEADAAIVATGCPCLMKPFPIAELESLVRWLFEDDARASTLRPAAVGPLPAAVRSAPAAEVVVTAA